MREYHRGRRMYEKFLTSNEVVELILHTSTVRLYPNVPSSSLSTALLRSHLYPFSALCLYSGTLTPSPYRPVPKNPNLKPRNIAYVKRPVELDSR